MAPAIAPALTLSNGVTMPALGLGVFQSPPEETTAAVEAALRDGYRHIDTAAAYGNEREVGEALRASGLDRSDVFLETKIWISDYGYDKTLHGFEKSARKLGVEQIDLLILHQALPSAFDRTLEAYRALETLLADGKVRAIGVSNFMVDHLTRLLEHASIVPAVNQIEQHPYFAQADVQAFGEQHDILAQAWSPIGGITFYRDSGHTSTLEDPTITGIADAHDKTPAQVMLCWGLQHGRSVIPLRRGQRQVELAAGEHEAPRRRRLVGRLQCRRCGVEHSVKRAGELAHRDAVVGAPVVQSASAARPGALMAHEGDDRVGRTERLARGGVAAPARPGDDEGLVVELGLVDGGRRFGVDGWPEIGRRLRGLRRLRVLRLDRCLRLGARRRSR